jgi:hypothetical protein
LSSTPIELMLMPLPRPDTTPPVTTKYFICARPRKWRGRARQAGLCAGVRGAVACASEAVGRVGALSDGSCSAT